MHQLQDWYAAKSIGGHFYWFSGILFINPEIKGLICGLSSDQA